MLPWTRRWKLSRELKKIRVKLKVQRSGRCHADCTRIFAEQMYPGHEVIPHIRKFLADIAEPIKQIELKEEKIIELLTPNKQHE